MSWKPRNPGRSARRKSGWDNASDSFVTATWCASIRWYDCAWRSRSPAISSTCDHPARRLARCGFRAQLSRRRRFARRAHASRLPRGSFPDVARGYCCLMSNISFGSSCRQKQVPVTKSSKALACCSLSMRLLRRSAHRATGHALRPHFWLSGRCCAFVCPKKRRDSANVQGFRAWVGQEAAAFDGRRRSPRAADLAGS